MANVCIVTAAGRVLIAAGPLPLVLTKIAIGSGNWVPTDLALALHTLVKEIPITDAATITDSTLHFAITDESADEYACREIGLYVGATLFAIYAQATPLFTKSAEALGLFAADVVIKSLPPGTITVGNAGFAYPQATETRLGVARIASQAVADAGLDQQRMMTPKTTKVLLDQRQPKDDSLTAIANLTYAADRLLFSTGPDAFALTAFTAFARTLLDDLNAAAALVTLGAAPFSAIGSDPNFITTVANALANKANTLGLHPGLIAGKASTLAQSGGNGPPMTFNWSGQGGQPTWLWGSNDGVNHYVYNPANFSVGYAANAGNAGYAGSAGNADMVDGYHAAQLWRHDQSWGWGDDTNGGFVMPNGRAMQYGLTGAIGDGSTLAVSFPAGFGVCNGVYPVPEVSGNAHDVSVYGIGSGGFSLRHYDNSGGGSCQVRWFALGRLW